jgi:REP-associated tyrosine transposase
MARLARVVVPECWHHITQRGNRKQTVFFDDTDRRMYLELLARHARMCSLCIVGYCLMGNHVHIVAIPARRDTLARSLGRAHVDYARWLNLRRGETGHVWQNRFFSCPMDDFHQWEALRYVEQNPVRAGLVSTAEQWRWSSAEAHTSGVDRWGVLDMTEWEQRWTASGWREALATGIDNAVLQERIREAMRTGRPAGSEEFLRRVEAQQNRCLHQQKRGPKAKAAPAERQLMFAG